MSCLAQAQRFCSHNLCTTRNHLSVRSNPPATHLRLLQDPSLKKRVLSQTCRAVQPTENSSDAGEPRPTLFADYVPSSADTVQEESSNDYPITIATDNDLEVPTPRPQSVPTPSASLGDPNRERVYLVGAALKNNKGKSYSYTVEESLEELGRLADTAGLHVMGSTFQMLNQPNNATYIGTGKVAEIATAVRALDVQTVIFDDELSPGQLRNLERALSGEDSDVRVCDRTALILDIFSQRAQTKEGKLQVELAQMEYQLPRLTRLWTHLERQSGGGQVKGMGEKQIEIDKRLLRDRIGMLKRELDSVRTHRRNYRNRRAETPAPVVALVGYTNAGKSTLLNTLTNAGVLAEDKLFATLDPTTRRVRVRGGREVLVSDTVGFIQKLPTQLVAAFRATLEEVQEASLVLHMVDISHPNAAAQSEAVMKVLREIGATDAPMITAWNKVDACAAPEALRDIAASRGDTVCISARNGEGLDRLLEIIADILEARMEFVSVLLPFTAGDLLADMHRFASIHTMDYCEEGTRVTASVPPRMAALLKDYAQPQAGEQPQAKQLASC